MSLVYPPERSSQRSGRSAAILVSAGIVLSLVGLVIALVVPSGSSAGKQGEPPPVPTATPTTVGDLADGPFLGSAATGKPSTTASSPGSATPATSGKPVRRDVPARSIIGPTFSDDDVIYDMALTGMPFDFHTPKTWGCVKGSVGFTAEAWRCLDENSSSSAPIVDIIAMKCASKCQEADREKVDDVLAYDPAYKTKDATTRWAEKTDENGRYYLAMNHVYVITTGQAAEWVIVTDASAKPENVTAVQKVVNDIWSQTV